MNAEDVLAAFQQAAPWAAREFLSSLEPRRPTLCAAEARAALEEHWETAERACRAYEQRRGRQWHFVRVAPAVRAQPWWNHEAAGGAERGAPDREYKLEEERDAQGRRVRLRLV